MELQRLKKYNKEYSYFRNEIDSLQDYLDRKSKINKHIRLIPEQVSEALKIPELDIIYIFSLAVQEHLMKKLFLVYTKNQEFLGSYDSTAKIPNEITNRNTGEPVEKDNFYINIAFEVE